MAYIVLTTSTVLTLLRWNQTEPHPVLTTTLAWHSEDGLRRLDTEARTELEHFGLLAGPNRDPRLDDALRALDRPGQELYGWITATIDGALRHYSVLVATSADHTAVVVHDHENAMIALNTVAANEAVAALSARIPPHHTLKAASINAPLEDFTNQPKRSDEGFRGIKKPSHPGTRALHALFTKPRTGAGTLYAAIRTPIAGRKRIEHPINYIDTEDGRWLTMISNNGNQQWVTATPATPDLIAHKLDMATTALASPAHPSPF